MTSIRTYRKAYKKLIENKNCLVVDENNNIIMSFEEYVAFCRNRVEYIIKKLLMEN